MVYLFKTFCMSFYGIELLYDCFNSKSFHKLNVAYHKAIKRIVNLSPWDSNHKACHISNLPIMKHMVASRVISFAFSIFFSKSRNISLYKYFFKCSSQLKLSCNDIFKDYYQISDVFENDLDAVKARIWFVQNHEEWSQYCP